MAKAKVDKIKSGLSGVAGEYFVAAQLSRLGYVASINLKNTRGVDILVMNEAAMDSVMIQVKTKQDSKREWMLTKKADTLISAKLFYVFVNLHGADGHPDYFIVPSAEVAAAGRKDHEDWLAAPGKKGPHKDNSIRMFRDPKGHYKDRWDLLGI